MFVATFGVGSSGWVETDLKGNSRRPSCEGVCKECGPELIDCRSFAGAILPRFEVPGAKLLILANTTLTFFSLLMLSGLPQLETIDARGSNLQWLSPGLNRTMSAGGLLPRLRRLLLDDRVISRLWNVAAWPAAAAITAVDDFGSTDSERFKHVCCELDAHLTPPSTTAGKLLYMCDTEQLSQSTLCPDCYFFGHASMPSHIRPVRVFYDDDPIDFPATSAEMCGEECMGLTARLDLACRPS